MTHFPNPHAGLVPIPVKSSDTAPDRSLPVEPKGPSLTATILDRLLNLTRPAPQETVADPALSGTWELRYLVDRDGIPKMLPEEITANCPMTVTGNGIISFDFGTTHAEVTLRRRACGRLVRGPLKMTRNFGAKSNAAAFRLERTVAAAVCRAADAAVVDSQMSLLGKRGEVLAILVRF